MSSLRPAAPGSSFFVDYFGFIPRLFRAQSYLPRVVEAEAAIAAAILGSSGLLSQVQKERLVLAIAAAHGNVYWATLACQTLSVLGVDDDELGQIVSASGPSRIEALDAALIGLAVKVAFNDVSAADVAKASAHGWNDQSILEAVLVASWANLACMLSAGLAAEP